MQRQRGEAADAEAAPAWRDTGAEAVPGPLLAQGTEPGLGDPIEPDSGVSVAAVPESVQTPHVTVVLVLPPVPLEESVEVVTAPPQDRLGLAVTTQTQVTDPRIGPLAGQTRYVAQCEPARKESPARESDAPSAALEIGGEQEGELGSELRCQSRQVDAGAGFVAFLFGANEGVDLLEADST
jgi:hypothetical protein